MIGNIFLFCESLISRGLRHKVQPSKRKRVFAEKRSLEVTIMKLFQSLIAAAALAIPAVSSFAQSNESVTRTNIQAAQTSVSPENATATDSGGIADGTSAAGARQPHSFRSAVSRLGHKIQGSVRPDANDGMKPVFFGS